MKIKEIQEIINFIKKSDLDDVSIETENIKIRVKKNNGYTEKFLKRRLTRQQVILQNSLRISSVCSPNKGERFTTAGESESLIGFPTVKYFPLTG